MKGIHMISDRPRTEVAFYIAYTLCTQIKNINISKRNQFEENLVWISYFVRSEEICTYQEHISKVQRDEGIVSRDDGTHQDRVSRRLVW